MVTREELYEAVWTEPLLKLADRFNVSDSYLARVCDSLRVPRPHRGYWAKKGVGKAPPKPILPPAKSGEPTEWAPGVMIRRSSPRREAQQTIRADSKTHPLLHGASGHFLHGRKSEEGYLKPFKRHLVDITVSEACLEQALSFANTLFLALETRGYRVSIFGGQHGSFQRPDVDPIEGSRRRATHNPHYGLWSPGRLTVVHVNGQTIGLSIVETAQETVMRYIGNGTYVPDASYVPPRTRSNPYPTWTTTKEKPSGRLRLVAYAPHYGVNLVRQWQAFGKTCFTKPANEIISSIEAMAVEMVPLVAAAEQQRETERRQREEQWHRYRKEEDRRRIEESIKESSEELNEIIRCWAETKARSEFLTGLEVELSKLGATERSELEGRVALARELLGSIEPLSRFKRWRAPSERYVPAKFEEEDGLITQS